MTDEYELLPAEELEALRKEVEHLKANPLGSTKENASLLTSVQQLTISINKLINVYGDIKQEMTDEYQKVKAVDEQLQELKEENKKIASGIITVARMMQDHHDVVQDHHEKVEQAIERPLQQEQPLMPRKEATSAFSTIQPPEPEQPPIRVDPNDPFSNTIPKEPQEVDPWQPQHAPPQPTTPPPQPQGVSPMPNNLPPPPVPPTHKKHGLFS